MNKSPVVQIRLGAATATVTAAIIAALFLSACGKTEPSAPVPSNDQKAAAESQSLIASAIANSDRVAGDSDEDEWRQPRVVLQFLGVGSGVHVLDYFAGSGYWSELLSRVVGPAGSVIVYNNKAYADFAAEKLVNRFANNRLANAKVVTVPTSELKVDANSLDGVLFYWSYHDLYWKPKDEPAPLGDPTQVTALLYQAVKPGGVVVVVDHVANPDGDTAKVVDALHRIDPQLVKIDFTKAGFILDAESDAFKHPEDDHTKLVFDPSIRHKTDRFMFRFRKPR